MIKLFQSPWSKWIPLASYEGSGNLYVIFVRKNFRTGMMKFRTKMINRPFTTITNLLYSQIDIGEQWRKICEVDQQKNDQQQNNDLKPRSAPPKQRYNQPYSFAHHHEE